MNNRLFLVDPLLHRPTAVIRRRFDEEANMQLCDFCYLLLFDIIYIFIIPI